MKTKTTRTILLEHSQAKVNLFARYISVYLNIIARARGIKQVWLFDLFCGEGIYEDASIGTPIAALDELKKHYINMPNSPLDVTLVVNDVGKSEVEPPLQKIDRVIKIASERGIPSKVKLVPLAKSYLDIMPLVIKKVEMLNSSQKAVVLLDPWGYKDIRPSDLKALLQNKRTELILFLPITFMYRFHSGAREPFKGSEAIEKLLNELWQEGVPSFQSEPKFILQLKNKLRDYTGLPFVSTFTLEHSKQQNYCLYFFTSNIKGFEKMLDTKHKLDSEQGRGHRLEKSGSLFSKTEVFGFEKKLFSFIEKKSKATNHELYEFGLHEDFLPTHIKQVLDEHKHRFLVTDESGMMVKNYYLGNRDKTVFFQLTT